MTQPPCLLEQSYYSRKHPNSKIPNYPFIDRQVIPQRFLTETQPYDCMFKILTVLSDKILRILAFYIPKGCSFAQPEDLPQALNGFIPCSKCPLYEKACEPKIEMTEHIQNIVMIKIWRNIKRNPTLM